MLTIEEIVKNGKEFNHQWIKEADPNHYLVQMAVNYIHPTLHNKFIETCCEITAEMIAEKLDVKKWKLVEASFQEVYKLSPLFRVSIGTTWDDVEHILTIWNECIIHSFFGHYSIRAIPLSEQLIEAFNLLNYDLINGLSIEKVSALPIKKKDLEFFYWIPT